MWGELPDKSRKISVAKDVFNQLDTTLLAERDVALRLYGHRRAGDCSDTELAVPFGSARNVVSQISDQVNAVSPKGKTPIARSLIAAVEDFNGRSGDVLLISDGIETCDADPCELVESWSDSNIDIRVHVVGLGLTDLSRSAMQCIAEASGATYLDANSGEELSIAIETIANSEIPEAGTPNPQPQEPGPEFKIYGEDENGNFVPVLGTISREGMAPEEIASNFRYVFEGGRYSITVGVPTVSGDLFMPITQEVDVKPSGRTKVIVQLTRPPAIRTRFVENGEEIRGVVSTVYQNNAEVFKLRPGEDYYVLPGNYDFSARLNQDNVLQLSETVSIGDDKDIVFDVIQTVRTYFNVYAKGQEKKLRQHMELWQDGELKYKVHVHNGKDIRPGNYTLRSEHILTPYEIENVQVSAVENQTLEFTIPYGAAKLNYVFNEEPESSDRRCWLYTVDEEGKHSSSRSKSLKCDGSEYVMAAGRYYVLTWSRLGEFGETYFDVTTGKTTSVSIQQVN